MENDIQKIACIACSCKDHKFFATKNSFDLYRCTKCDHIMIYPFTYNTGTIYGDDYFSGADKGSGYVDYDSDKEPMRPVFEKYIRLINKELKTEGKKLLDIGAATGFFAEIAKNAGHDAYGIEISDYAARIGREKGLQIETGTLTNLAIDAESFDIVTMWDVIEHFPNPDRDFETVTKLMKPGAILAINTPDSGSLYARMLGKRWHLIVPPEHVNYFSRKSLRLFLEKHDFEVITMRTIGKTFTLEYVFHILSAWTKLSFFQKLAHSVHGSKLLSRIALPINLFDNMFVLARKNNRK